MLSYLLLLFTFLSIRTVSTTTDRFEAEIDNNPRHLSSNQFSTVLKFDRYDQVEEEQQQEQQLGILATSWDPMFSSFWDDFRKAEENVTPDISSSTLPFLSSMESLGSPLYPFLLCHLDKTSTNGSERYKLIKEEILKENEESSLDFFLNELPVYNHNFDANESQKQQQQIINEEEKETRIFGACFYGSMSYVVARNLKRENALFATPMLPDLKIRRGISITTKSNEKDKDKNLQSTSAISVRLSPGISKSENQVLETAHTLLDFGKNVLNDASLGDCSDSAQFLSSPVILVNSMDISSFTYQLEKSKSDDNVISNECVLYFIEFLVKQPQVLSVERVPQTAMLNDVASWIIQGYPEENNSRPWFEAGVRGEGEIIQLLDSGIDENSCYLKDASGIVPLTTDYDLTGGRIDLTKRKIVQYVALNTFNGDREDRTSHGTHIAVTIAGKRSDDGVTEIDGMVDGVSPGVKIAFFDAHNDPTDDSFSIPSDISYLFYFGRKAGARIHSASWGVHVNGEYTERVRLIDTYFYNDEDDGFIMFAAAGNDGLESTSTVVDPSLAKNVISVGASHSHGDDLSNNMLDMNYIAAFSSRGLTADRRIKPDIVAPGHSILSTAANTGKCDPAVRPKYDPDNKEHGGVMFMSGTSMSCPIAAGAGALVRQYFKEVYDPPMDISGTLLKAVLVNGGEALVGRSTTVFGTGSMVSTQYDIYQGFGKVNLLNSLKHTSPNVNSPDLHVEDARVLQQGQSHEYEFNLCDSREFRVTIVWKDPPNGSAGCQKCLVNDLDLEVESRGLIYYPNGRSAKDNRNNIERIVLDELLLSGNQNVFVRVKASNLGYGNVQLYSLASTGCIDNVEFVSPTPSPTKSCGGNQFEYTLEIFTDRAPEDTSWSLEYQGSGGIVDVGIAGEYDEKLNTYLERGCARYDCFIFVIRDKDFNGLCCSNGMGSYRISVGDEVLINIDSFDDRQEIEKFCYYGNNEEVQTPSPTVTCDDDEFRYSIELTTDLYPDETRWEIKKAQIDGVKKGYYTEINTEEIYYGSCIDYGCYDITFHSFWWGMYYSYKVMVGGNVIISDETFSNTDVVKTFCYWDNTVMNEDSKSGHKNTTKRLLETPSSTSENLTNPSLVVCEEEDSFRYDITITTNRYPEQISWELTYDNGTLIDKVFYHYTEKLTDYVHSYFLCDGCYVFKIYSGMGLCCLHGNGRYEVKVGDYILAEGSVLEYGVEETKEFCYTGIETSSPTESPLVCSEGQFRYDIAMTTSNPHYTWWELYPEQPLVNSVEYMTYKDQLKTYQQFGCAKKDGRYEFIVFDNGSDRSGLCCYFGNGSYLLSSENEVLVQGNMFEAEDYFYYYKSNDRVYYEKKEFCFQTNCQLSTAIPTLTPEIVCDDDQHEYTIEIHTDFSPRSTSWTFEYSNGDLIDSIGRGEYLLLYHKYVHKGCISLNGCYVLVVNDNSDGLCCGGGYKVTVEGHILAEGGGDFIDFYEEAFCYGPSYSFSPSALKTENPSHSPSSPLICDESEFKYDLIVITDFRYQETSWELSYDNGTLIDSVEEGFYTERYTQHVHSYCLRGGCFRYKIYDSGGNGSRYGGGYTIRVGESILAEEGEFSYEETKDFCYYGVEVNPPPTIQPSLLICDENSYKYELVISRLDDDYIDEIQWNFRYKYPVMVGWELPHGYPNNYLHNGIIDRYIGYFPPNSEERRYGCLKYDSCFKFIMRRGFFKLTDMDTGILIAQSTQLFEQAKFCHYTPAPTQLPTQSPTQSPTKQEEAIFAITLTFSTYPLDVENVSKVIKRSIRKILFRAVTNNNETHNNLIVEDEYSSCEEFRCDVSFEVCSRSCEDEVEEGFLAFIVNTMNENVVDGSFLQTVKQTGDYMVVDIFDGITNNIHIEFDFDYYTLPTTSPTGTPSLTSTQERVEPPYFILIIERIFTRIIEIVQPVTQPLTQSINSTINNITNPIFDLIFGVKPHNSTAVTCKDKMFILQLEIQTDSTPRKTSWELMYENGTIIESIGRDTYIEENSVYYHNYCLDTSCFVFRLFDSFVFDGSYKITGNNAVLAQEDSFWWKETKHFCYPQCEGIGMFPLQIELTTDDWPHETSWRLALDNGTEVDSVDERYYTELNTLYSHRYCLHVSCFVFSIEDMIGDGICCFYGKGSYKIKVNNEILKEGGEFKDGETVNFCYPPRTEESSSEDCEDKSLIDVIVNALS